MTRYTVFGKATKCPNCHAYLTGAGAQIRCEYCGVVVTVEAPKEARNEDRPPAPQGPPPPVIIRQPDPTQLVRAPKVRTWPYFLVAPLMTGAILYYSYFMQRQAMERTQAVTDQVQRHASEVQAEVESRTRPVRSIADDPPPPTTSAKPPKGKPKIDSICHLSAMELQAAVDAGGPQVAACFDEAPKSVKRVEADVTLVVDPAGTVSDVELAWDGWKPDAKMRKCASRKISAWKMAKPSGSIATRCQVRVSVEPP